MILIPSVIITSHILVKLSLCAKQCDGIYQLPCHSLTTALAHYELGLCHMTCDDRSMIGLAIMLGCNALK